MTPYDTLPIEIRRMTHGWFGKPWWSYTCYDENGRLITEMRKPFPAGEKCLHRLNPYCKSCRHSMLRRVRLMHG